MKPVLIIGARRTAIGSFGGEFRDVKAVTLGAAAARAALTDAGVPAGAVASCVFGNARQAGGGPNPARQVAHAAGMSDDAPAYTVNAACASGMKAVELAAREIESGSADCALAGGAEAMSRIPYLLDRVRWGARMGNAEVVDAMFRDGYFCPISEMLMGETAEALADEFGIGRAQQDQYAHESHQRALRALAAGTFAGEIAPVEVTDSKGKTTVVTRDEHPRPDTSLESLARLKPVFRREGTVTAGNASAIADGGAALVMASEEFARAHELRPLARILDIETAAVPARRMGMSPVPAVRRLIGRLGFAIGDFDVIELNEAFAAQVLACDRELHFPGERLNVNGGAVALGHPTGCSGARIVVTALHELRRRGGGRALATLCASGGVGMAIAVETV
jgi:acetyl-CoA C-acetyltransferase